MTVATRIFATKGLSAASVDEIAQAAGYTRGAFYSNYETKEQLFVDVLRRRFVSEIEAYSTILHGRGEVADKTKALGDWLAKNADPVWCSLVIEFQLQAGRDARVRASFDAIHGYFRRELEGLLADFFAAAGTTPSRPIADVTELLLTVAYGSAVRRVAFEGTPSATVGTLVQYVLESSVAAGRQGKGVGRDKSELRR